MHHKRGRATSRKEGKRLDNKRARAAEGRALSGARPSPVHTDYSWGLHPVQPPLLDGIGQTKRGKKQPSKKERCPVNRYHECLTEEREVERARFYPDFRIVKKTKRFKLCVHCGKEWVWGYSKGIKARRLRRGWRSTGG